MKKSMIKRMVSLLLVLMMGVSMVGCGKSTETGSGETVEQEVTTSTATDTATDPATDDQQSGKTPQDFDTFVIGIAEAQANDETVNRRDYLENYIAPKYNVKFIFSEALSDSGAVLTFIENCADAGAHAIIDYRSFDDAAQMAATAEEYGMFYMYNGGRREEVYSENREYFVGSFEGNIPMIADLFAKYLEENASEDGSEGFVIASMLAPSNNVQHVEITKSSLKALQEKYDLKFEDTIENITITDAPLQVANDKGLNITVYPGSPRKDSWLPGLSAILQTGKYGVVMSAGQTYTNSSVVIDEVEQQFGFNIKVVSVGSLGTSLTTAFETKDKFGNSSIDFATVKSNSLLSGGMFAMIYNALTGYGKNLKQSDGTATTFSFNQWPIASAEQLASMSGWDTPGEDKWIFDTEMVDQLLGIYNPDLNPEKYQEVLNSCTYETTLERFSK